MAYVIKDGANYWSGECWTTSKEAAKTYASIDDLPSTIMYEHGLGDEEECTLEIDDPADYTAIGYYSARLDEWVTRVTRA